MGVPEMGMYYEKVEGGYCVVTEYLNGQIAITYDYDEEYNRCPFKTKKAVSAYIRERGLKPAEIPWAKHE